MARHEGAEHHKQAAEHHEHAARHHLEAAKHHEAGAHEKAGHHAHIAHGHHLHATHHAEESNRARFRIVWRGLDYCIAHRLLDAVLGHADNLDYMSAETRAHVSPVNPRSMHQTVELSSGLASSRR